MYYTKSLVLKDRFKCTEKCEWTPITLCCELNIQVGHLTSLLIKNNNVHSSIVETFRNVDNISDEICDVLFQLFNISGYYKIKLSKNRTCFGINIDDDISICDLSFCIVSLTGEITDAFLRMYGYKDDLSRSIHTEFKFIKNKIYDVFLVIFKLVELMKININNEYDLMIKSADYYLKKRETLLGKYCSISFEQDTICKRISELKRPEYDIYKFCCNNNIEDSIKSYLRELHFNNIKIAPIEHISTQEGETVIKQKRIYGKTLSVFISTITENISDDNLIIYKNIYKKMIDDIFENYRYNQNIRVDLNLNNFIVEDITNDIFLVDIIPPIYVDRISKCNFQSEYLYKLYTDFIYQILAFLYYYLKPMIINSGIDITLNNVLYDTYCKLANYTQNKLYEITNDRATIKRLISNSATKNKYKPYSLYLEIFSKFVIEEDPNKKLFFYNKIKRFSFTKYIDC